MSKRNRARLLSKVYYIFKEISVKSRFNHSEPLNESGNVTSRFNIWDTENTDQYESSDLHRIDRQRLYRSHRHELRATKHDRFREWNIKQTCSRHGFVICRLVIFERRRMFLILFSLYSVARVLCFDRWWYL